jgi:hypothetical protein
MHRDSELLRLELQSRNRCIDPSTLCESDFLITYTRLYIDTILGGLRDDCSYILKEKQGVDCDVTAVLPPVGDRLDLLYIDYFIDKSTRPKNPLKEGLLLCKPHLAELGALGGEALKEKVNKILEHENLDDAAVIIILEKMKESIFNADNFVAIIDEIYDPQEPDVFDELASTIRNGKNNRIKIIFCFNHSQSHWLTAEILIYQDNNSIELQLLLSDPYSKSKVTDNKDSYSRLEKSIKARLTSLGPFVISNVIRDVTKYSPRQSFSNIDASKHDGTSCGFIACDDMMKRIADENLSIPNPYPVGCLDLREKMIALVYQRTNEDKRGKWLMEYTHEVISRESSRIKTIIEVINKTKSLYETGGNISALTFNLFKISWLCAELPRHLKFNSDSEFSKIDARNWIMLDFLSISLREALTSKSKMWSSAEYGELLEDLYKFKSNLECLKLDKNAKNLHTELKGMNKVIGALLDQYCFNLSINAIDTVFGSLNGESEDIYAVLRVYAIIGESCKLFSPNTRNLIRGDGESDIGLLKILGDLRDLIIHDKDGTFQLLQANLRLKNELCDVVLHSLRRMFVELNNSTGTKLDYLEPAIAILMSFSNNLKAAPRVGKAKINIPIDMGKITLHLQLLRWALPRIDEFNYKEDLVEWIIAHRLESNIYGISQISESDLRDFYKLSSDRLVSFYGVKEVSALIQKFKGDSTTQTERKKYIKNYFLKSHGDNEGKKFSLAFISELSLVPERLRGILENFVKGHHLSLAPEHKYEERKKIIQEQFDSCRRGAYEDYRRYQDFIKESPAIKCFGRRNNDSVAIDHKLFAECFPDLAKFLIEDIVERSSEFTPLDLLLLMAFTENKQILEQAINEKEYRAEAHQFMCKWGVPLDKMDEIYFDLKKLSKIKGLEITEEKSALVRKLISLIKVNPSFQLVKPEEAFVTGQIEKLKFEGDLIPSEEISRLVREISKMKYIKDKVMLDELSKELCQCDKASAGKVVRSAIVKRKVHSSLESEVPLENRDKKTGDLFTDLMRQVSEKNEKSACEVIEKTLIVLIKSDREQSYDRIIESLSKKCVRLLNIFLAYNKEANQIKRAKLRLVAEYLVEDIGEESEVLVSHTSFSDTRYHEISKRNLLIIAFVRKCIAHFPLSVNISWFEYLMEVVSIAVPSRLNQLLKLTELDIWRRIYHHSRKVDIAEFREDTDMYIDFQMSVEQCGYNPIVKIVNTPVGVMGDFTVLVEPNKTNTATLWDLFELEIQLSHLLNADVKVDTAHSFHDRAKNRAMPEHFQVLEEAKPLAELVMRDTVTSLLKVGDFSKLGQVGKSDFVLLDTLFKLVSMLSPHRVVSISNLLVIISDESEFTKLTALFFKTCKETETWDLLEEWCQIFKDNFLMPLLLEYRPVSTRLYSRTLSPLPIMYSEHMSAFVGLPPQLDFVPSKYQMYYIFNPDINMYRKVDYVFENIKKIIKNRENESQYLSNIAAYIYRCFSRSHPQIANLIIKARNIETVKNVDRVRDQGFLNDYYSKIKLARLSRLESREDISAIIKDRAVAVAQRLNCVLLRVRNILSLDQWKIIETLLVLFVENNVKLDQYYFEHESDLTQIYQSMDENERRAYGVMISHPELYKNKINEHHVTSKYTFRVIARHAPNRYRLSGDARENLRQELKLHSNAQNDSALYAQYLKLQFIFHNFSSLLALKALLNPLSTNRSLVNAFEQHLRDQYCDDSAGPLVVILLNGHVCFEALSSEIEQAAFNQREILNDWTKKLTAYKKWPPILRRVLEEDLTVFHDLNNERAKELKDESIKLPPIFNGITGFSSELDRSLSQLHGAISSRSILTRATDNITRVDLIDFLDKCDDYVYEYIGTIHSTMALYEWSIASIDDLLELHDWSAMHIAEYQQNPAFIGHKRVISEYYQFRKLHDILKSYQERAGHYVRKIQNNFNSIEGLELSSVNTNLLKANYLREKNEDLRDAYRLNRENTVRLSHEILSTDFVKRRMLRLISMNTIIQPLVSEIIEHQGDKNIFMLNRVSDLVLSIRGQVWEEIKQDTNFSNIEEQKFGSWLNMRYNLAQPPLSPNNRVSNLNRFYSSNQGIPSAVEDSVSNPLISLRGNI